MAEARARAVGALRDEDFPGWLVRNRNFVLLWAAYGISAVGDHLSEMALLTERDAFSHEHATRIQALIQFGFFLPFVLLGPVAGWWADRFSRKWTMILSDVLRAGIMLSLIWSVPVLIGWLEPVGWGDYAIVLPLFFTGALAAFFSPSRQALLPTMIRTSQLVRANAMISALGTIGTILSAVLGGIIVKRLGKDWNYTLDAGTFLLSAALLCMLSMQRTRAAERPKLVGVWTPLRDGFAYVWRHRRVLELILLGTVFWGAAGVVISVVPAVVRDVFGGDVEDAGVYRGLIGIGLALGATVMTILGATVPISLAVLVGLVGGTAATFGLGAAYMFKLGGMFTGFCLLAIGGAGATLLVTIMATIQRFVPDAKRGRTFGVSDMCTMGAMVLTTGLLGLPDIPNLDRYVPVLLGLTAAGLAGTGVAAWRKYREGETIPAVTSLMWKLGTFVAQFWYRVRREGYCTVPRRGPVIVAANHTAGVDPVLLLGTCRHRLMGFLVERRYYERRVLGWFQRLVGCVPVDRERPEVSAVRGAIRFVESGGCLGIFPEGGFLGKPGEGAGEAPVAKSGLGFIALRSGATIVPVHIGGTKRAENPIWSLFQRHDARVRYGKPMDALALTGGRRDRAAAREVTEAVMKAIGALGAEEVGGA